MSQVSLAEVDAYLNAAELFADQGDCEKALAALQAAYFLLGKMIEQEQSHGKKIILSRN